MEEMDPQEKRPSNRQELLLYLEKSLINRITRFEKMYQNLATSQQYELNRDFRDQCEIMKGLLVEMKQDLEVLRQRKGKLP